MTTPEGSDFEDDARALLDHLGMTDPANDGPPKTARREKLAASLWGEPEEDDA